MSKKQSNDERSDMFPSLEELLNRVRGVFSEMDKKQLESVMPCPFCGAKIDIWEHDEVYLVIHPDPDSARLVRSDVKEFLCPMISRVYPSLEDAVSALNRRHTPFLEYPLDGALVKADPEQKIILGVPPREMCDPTEDADD